MNKLLFFSYCQWCVYRNQLKSAVLMDLENGDNITQDMASQVALTGQVLDVDSISAAIDSVTAADVQSVSYATNITYDIMVENWTGPIAFMAVFPI